MQSKIHLGLYSRENRFRFDGVYQVPINPMIAEHFLSVHPIRPKPVMCISRWLVLDAFILFNFFHVFVVLLFHNVNYDTKKFEDLLST